MRTSPAGIALIKKFEGCKLAAYLDRLARRPVWTIGYGCTGPDVYEGLVITQEQAEHMLAVRLAREFEPGVLEAIGDAPLTQSQFDAMVSLAWNIGVGRLDDPATPQNEACGLTGSSVARYHRAGNYPAAALAFELWNKAGGRVLAGLIRRREEEAELYLSELPAGANGAKNIPENIPTTAYARADAARDMQTALARLGLYTGKIDGLWFTKSRAAYNVFNKG